MRTPTRASLAALVVLAGACGPVGVEPAAGASGAVARSGPADVARAVIAADNAGDLEAVLALYAEDAELWPPGEPPTRGKAAIADRYREILSSTRLALETRVLRVRQADDWALVEGTVQGTASPRGDGPSRQVDDKYFMVLELRDGSWRITRLLWSSNG